MWNEAPRPPEMPPEAPQPAPKTKRTGLYIGIVLIVVIVIGIVGAIAYFASLPRFIPTFTPTKTAHHIDYFLVTEKDDLLQVQFALMSEDLAFISTDGTAKLTISDEVTNQTVYETQFTIKKATSNIIKLFLAKRY